jgi:hypothetical protein
MLAPSPAPSAAARAIAALAPVRLCQTINRRDSVAAVGIRQGWPARLSIVNHAHLSALHGLR